MTSILERPVKTRRIGGTSLRRRVADKAATLLVTLSIVIILVPLVWMLYSVASRGFRAILGSLWWTHSQAGLTAFVPGGGAYHAIVGTMLQGLMSAVIAIPISIFLAIYLVEYGADTWLGRRASFMVDILAGVPSIIAAVFIYAVWVASLDFPRSGLAVSLALVLLMIPVIVRATEEMLRIVPMDLREASYALGIPKWKTIVRIVLPAGLSGIITGIMLALTRVLGETAPLLILVGYSQVINFDMFKGFMASLPSMIYDQASAGAGAYANPTDRLWGAALTLIMLIAFTNVFARLVTKVFAPKAFN